MSEDEKFKEFIEDVKALAKQYGFQLIDIQVK